MATELQVNVLSPAKVVARTKARHVLVPGSEGQLGVLPGHTRFITELGVGELKVEGEAGGKEERFFVSGGYLDVANDNVTVLADVIERITDIDVARAEKSKARALDRLAKREEVDMVRAQAALMRATVRIDLAARR